MTPYHIFPFLKFFLVDYKDIVETVTSP